MSRKISVTYNGQQVKVKKRVAFYLESERKREQAGIKSDIRHLSDFDIDREDLHDFMSDKPIDFAEGIAEASEAEALRRALDSLTEIQRRRVQMYFFDGFTYRQIAEFENANEKSIREAIGGASKKLKSFFE